MGKHQHQVQHRERRDESRARELADLKKENLQLKRQVARLSKHLNKVLDAQAEKEESATQEHQEQRVKAAPKKVDFTCPSCESINVKKLPLRTGVLVACKDCGWRAKEESK
jgi:predicted RNA-binding Zn-ribbon protein involved in translation (DUF1610 family)